MTVIFGYPKGKPLGLPPKLPLEEIVYSGTYREPDGAIIQRWIKEWMAAYRSVFITRSFNSQIKSYLSRVDEAEKGLNDIIFYPQEGGRDDSSLQ